MADLKISGLPAVVTPVGTDEFAVNQSGTTKKETLSQIVTFLALDVTYLRLDTTNDPLTGNLDLGGNTLEGDNASGGNLILTSTSHATKGTIFLTDSEVIINDNAGDYDFRVEGFGKPNAFFVQGSDGFVGIGTNVPTNQLDVRTNQNTIGGAALWNFSAGTAAIGALFFVNNGLSATPFIGFSSTNYTGPGGADAFLLDASSKDFVLLAGSLERMRFKGTGEVVFNDAGLDYDLRIEAVGQANAYLLQGSNGFSGFNNGSPLAQVDIIGDMRTGDSTTNYVETESDGDMNFVGGAGLQFGGIYCFEGNSTVSISGTGIANKVQITCFDTNESSNGDVIPDHTNDHVTTGKTGKYLVTVSIHIDSLAGIAAKFGFGLFKNNGATLFQNLHAHRNLPAGAGGNAGSVSMSGIIDGTAADTIEVWVWNETNTQNIVVDDITLSLVQIGG